MEIKAYKNGFFIENNKYFDPYKTFDCGQCFRFKKTEKGIIGVAFGRVITIEEEKSGCYIYGNSSLGFDVIKSFLDCENKYDEIEEFLKNDEIMAPALSFGCGIRILKQEFFETLISFIISQQNNIPRITKTVEKFSELFGDKIEYKGEIFHTFPRAEQLKDITVFDLEPLRCGYRASYIIDAIEKVLSGEIDFSSLKSMDYITAKNRLLTIKGVGSKVADCICLFSLGQFSAFPTDTWIKKAMQQLYSVPEKEILQKSQTLFGEYSGIAQQFLFYYLRYNKKVHKS